MDTSPQIVNISQIAQSHTNLENCGNSVKTVYQPKVQTRKQSIETAITHCTRQPDNGDVDVMNDSVHCTTSYIGKKDISSADDIYMVSFISHTESGLDDCSVPLESQNVAIRPIDLMDIDCMTPENIKLEQEKDSVLSLIRQWKMEGQKPPWTMVEPYGAELKSYWAQWESIIITDNIVYRKWECCERNGEARNQVLLPLSLCRKAIILLHETVTAGHLGQQKTLGKIKHGFTGIAVGKILSIDVEFVMCVLLESNPTGKPKHP